MHGPEPVVERVQHLADRGIHCEDVVDLPIEEVTIKKRKLLLKDRMEDIMRRYRPTGSTAS